MPTQDTGHPSEIVPSKAGVVVLSGYDVSVSVQRGHLVVRDGYGPERREGRLSRATSRLKRLVVLGHTGFITLQALRWLSDLGVSYVQIDKDGQLVALYAPPGRDDARVRRAQALATTNGKGLEIAREIIRAKLTGQRQVLAEQFAESLRLDVVDEALADLDAADSARAIMVIEARAAMAYWEAWATLPIRFARADQSRVPAHWLSFGDRSSPLTKQPRKAVTPGNSILNYAYTLLQAEARIAALTLGLDPGLGVLHADDMSKDSLALDLMEPVRPQVDALVLELLRRRTFSAREFWETPTGECRMVAPLPEQIVALCGQLARWVSPVAERVANQLVAGAPGERRASASVAVPSLLSQGNRRLARGTAKSLARAAKPLVPPKPVASACRACGAVVPGERSYCDDCLPDHQTTTLETLSLAGPAALAQMRTEGHDPTQTSEAQRRRRESRARTLELNREWELHHERPPETVFRDHILPRLSSVTITAMERATGLSASNCSHIRAGSVLPHPRHWEPLAQLVESKRDGGI